VAQKVGVVETAEAFFRKRAEGGSAQSLLEILAKAPDVQPEERDRR
jgi:hypothetical protein